MKISYVNENSDNDFFGNIGGGTVFSLRKENHSDLYMKLNYDDSDNLYNAASIKYGFLTSYSDDTKVTVRECELKVVALSGEEV